MNLNFDKSERLIKILISAESFLTPCLYGRAYNLNNSESEDERNLYRELVEITNSSASKEEKHLARVAAVAKVCNNVDGNEMLKRLFDEEYYKKELTRVVWLLDDSVRYNGGRNFPDDKSEDLKRFIDKKFPDVTYKDIMCEAIRERAPHVADIESEFLSNCPTLNDIPALLNIYKGKWDNVVAEVDMEYFYQFMWEFKKGQGTELRIYIDCLHETGLIVSTELEGLIFQAASCAHSTTLGLKEMFRKLKIYAGIQEPAQNTIAPSPFRIAKGRKTDFVKIISAMYDLHLFETPGGMIASNKQGLFDALGSFLGEDFTGYSALLGAAKAQAKNFTDVFDKLKTKAADYEDK
ncbi:MAG: hypothetical protein LBS55_13295 [Prevotellaceae bacterium]|jgi:hypothetical protein|nr:hypothetical protein [Prevotellaceae bacterium]